MSLNFLWFKAMWIVDSRNKALRSISRAIEFSKEMESFDPGQAHWYIDAINNLPKIEAQIDAICYTSDLTRQKFFELIEKGKKGFDV